MRAEQKKFPPQRVSADPCCNAILSFVTQLCASADNEKGSPSSCWISTSTSLCSPSSFSPSVWALPSSASVAGPRVQF